MSKPDDIPQEVWDRTMAGQLDRLDREARQLGRLAAFLVRRRTNAARRKMAQMRDQFLRAGWWTL